MTAYEMRISDWSSDVCSSDLPCRSFLCCSTLGWSRSWCQSDRAQACGLIEPQGEVHALDGGAARALGKVVYRADGDQLSGLLVDGHLQVHRVGTEHRPIGRASGREKV